MFYTLLIRCFTPFSFRVLHPVCSVFYTFSEKRPSTVKRKTSPLRAAVAVCSGATSRLGRALVGHCGQPSQGGTMCHSPCATSRLGRALCQAANPSLPSRDNVPLSLRNVSAWERSAHSSGKFGRSWRNFPAWERCGCARSRLGRIWRVRAADAGDSGATSRLGRALPGSNEKTPASEPACRGLALSYVA